MVSNPSAIGSQIPYINAPLLRDTSKILAIFRKSYGPGIGTCEVGCLLVSLIAPCGLMKEGQCLPVSFVSAAQWPS